MSGRHSRSASIPIPSAGSATARTMSLENAIPIPSLLSSRLPATPAPARRDRDTSPDDRRLPYTPGGAVPPRRIVPRSFSAGTGAAPVPTFEPRIIRATTTTNPRDAACIPLPLGTSSSAASVSGAGLPGSTSPVRPRRMSANMRSTTLPGSSALSTSAQHRSASYAHTAHTPSAPQPHGFPRPAYLEYSALRDLLQSDATPSASASRHGLSPSLAPSLSLSTTTTHPSYFGRATSSPSPYPYLRRELTPVADSDEESNASPPPVPPPGASSSMASALAEYPALRLPTRWSEQDRHPSLTVSADGRDLTFFGQSCAGDRDSAAARANYPMPPACGIYYYEVEILHRGSKGHISIGFSAGDVRLSRLPGWEKQSWGYHADDGCAFQGQKDGSSYGPTFDSGDVIGCGIDFSQNRAFYTKNGAFLGMVFDSIFPAAATPFELFPAIGLRHNAESVRANFGAAPFRYAIADHVRAQRDKVWVEVMRRPVDWGILSARDAERESGEQREREEHADAEGEAGAGMVRSGLGLGSAGNVLEEEEAKAPLRKLVLAYLAHHGYARTARAFQARCAQTGSVLVPGRALATVEGAGAGAAGEEMDTDEGEFVPSSEPVPGPSSAKADADPFTADLETRIAVVNALLAGDVDAALTSLQTHHPAALEWDGGRVLFKLRCRRFVELVLQAGEALRKVREVERELKAASEARAATDGGTGEHMMNGAAEADEAAMLDGEDGVQDEMDADLDMVGAMDIDDNISTPEPISHSHSAPHSSSTSQPPLVASSSAPSAIPSSDTDASAQLDVSSAGPSSSVHATLSAHAKSLLHSALEYGQALEAEYKADTRPGVRTHLRRTFGVVAYEDPERASGEVALVAGQGARAALAAEVNQTILESQGLPAHPALETLFRQAGACVAQLGLMGVGKAVFADVRREFLEE
ncbi:SPRY-domain-containing protein [Obba rivulosa]|uniref:SPRY-domain-containing protein n=1 Tax=Obba rivulosa TaxID=1052685 RepID=A0A8E2AM25_9APHY|nr:SPRY-domain-containing protein [Obba rivulosa]